MQVAAEHTGSYGWLRIAGLAAAGLAAFALAAILSGPLKDADPLESDVVAPSKRHLRATSLPSAPPGEVAAPAVPVADGPNERLNDLVVHNPFGALHLPSVAPPQSPASAQRSPLLAAATTKKMQAQVPQPLPPASLPPPVAPPLPFISVGAITGPQVADGRLIAFIRQQDNLLLVRAGDAIGQTYRVESITTQRIEFMYLPLMQRQTLALAP
jgi:hypothetical protein